MKSREWTSEGVRVKGQVEKSFAVLRDDAKDTYPAQYINTKYITFLIYTGAHERCS